MPPWQKFVTQPLVAGASYCDEINDSQPVLAHMFPTHLEFWRCFIRGGEGRGRGEGGKELLSLPGLECNGGTCGRVGLVACFEMGTEVYELHDVDVLSRLYSRLGPKTSLSAINRILFP